MSRKFSKMFSEMVLGETIPTDIGAPTNFMHKSHIGFDSSSGVFNISDIPEDWKKLFKKAGIRKSELRDPETAEIVFQVTQAEMRKSIAFTSSAAFRQHAIASDSKHAHQTQSTTQIADTKQGPPRRFVAPTSNVLASSPPPSSSSSSSSSVPQPVATKPVMSHRASVAQMRSAFEHGKLASPPKASAAATVTKPTPAPAPAPAPKPNPKPVVSHRMSIVERAAAFGGVSAAASSTVPAQHSHTPAPTAPPVQTPQQSAASPTPATPAPPDSSADASTVPAAPAVSSIPVAPAVPPVATGSVPTVPAVSVIPTAPIPLASASPDNTDSTTTTAAAAPKKPALPSLLPADHLAAIRQGAALRHVEVDPNDGSYMSLDHLSEHEEGTLMNTLRQAMAMRRNNMSRDRNYTVASDDGSDWDD
jgi:P21-Rho-binding domain